MFEKLVISNYRSIGEELTLRFPGSNRPLRLVGPNGSGKSNVLSALGTVLDVYPFDREQPSEDDFHKRDAAQEIRIELHLRTPLVERDAYQKEVELHGFRFSAWRKERAEEKGRITSTNYCFGSDGKEVMLSRRLYKKNAEPGIDNKKYPVFVSDQVRRLGQCFFVEPAGLERFFEKSTGYGPMGRLFESYRADFPSDKNQFLMPTGESIPRRDALDRLSAKVTEVLRTDLLKEIEGDLGSFVRRYLGAAPQDPLAVLIEGPSRSDLLDQLDLAIQESPAAPRLPSERLGSGYRALLRLAVLETLAKRSERPLILLLEEPEVYLHVHLARYFNRALTRLAEGGHVVVLTTHSPSFVDLSDPHGLVRLHRVDLATSAKQVREDAKFDFDKASRKVAERGNEELVFARHAILTEGMDDKLVIERALEALGVDASVNGLSVIACGGKDNLPDYIRLCDQLGIDFYVTHDEDDAKRDARKNALVRAAVDENKAELPRLHLFTPKMENALGVPKPSDPSTLTEAVDSAVRKGLATAAPQLWKPLDEFLSTRRIRRAAAPGSGPQ